MIECEIIGGPKDGTRVALSDPYHPFNVAVPFGDYVKLMLEEQHDLTAATTYRVVTMDPEYEPDRGWVLHWKEPKC